MYSGSIFYLVHFPVGFFSISDENNRYSAKNYSAHIKKILRLIKFSQQKGIPIVLEIANGKIGEFQLELLQRFCEKYNLNDNIFKRINEFDVVSNNFKKAFEEIGIIPEKVFVAGWTKERCVLRSLLGLRKYSANLDLTLLKGNFTLASKNFKGYSSLEKDYLKRFLREQNVKKSVLAKKITLKKPLRHNPM